MKWLKIMAMCAMLFMSCSVFAKCTGQETTVVFINGVWTTEAEVIKHTLTLKADAEAEGINPDCVHFAYSHTVFDGESKDIAEAIVQKSNEMNIPILQIVRGINWLFVWDLQMRVVIDDILVKTYKDTTQIIEAQLKKHVDKFRELTKSTNPDPSKRQLGVMVTHSQGGLYGNSVWEKLTTDEQTKARLITVATPSDHVANYDANTAPNTRLSRDGAANKYFYFSLASGMIANTALCETETVAEENSWACHGFETGYLHDVEAKNQIITDIKNVLPIVSTATILGTVKNTTGTVYLGNNVKVSLYASQFGALVAETSTDPFTGEYRFDNVPTPHKNYLLEVKTDGNICHESYISVKFGDIINNYPTCDLPPTPVTSSILYDGSSRAFSLDGSLSEQFLPPLSPQISGTITGIMIPIMDSNIPISNQYYITIFKSTPPWTEVARSDYIPLNIHSLTQVYFHFSTPFTLVDSSYGIDVCQNGYSCAHTYYSPITPQSSETSPLWRPFIGIVYGMR